MRHTSQSVFNVHKAKSSSGWSVVFEPFMIRFNTQGIKYRVFVVTEQGGGRGESTY